MKTIIALFFLFSFTLQINAQDSQIYTESGTSFFLQAGPADNLYSKITTTDATISFFSDAQSSKTDRSISLGIALELVRGNVGFRLQTNRIRVDETFEMNSDITDNIFGQFISKSSTLIRGEQINYEVIPGIHRYFQVNKWLFSGGIEMPFTVYDIYKFSHNTESEFASSSPGFSFEQNLTDNMTGEIPGGYDIGIGANFGVQHAFNNTIKIAIQYAPSMRHYKIGGETEFTRETRQIFVEQFENDPPTITDSATTTVITNTSTQSKFVEFRQKMNFALIFSF